jgi:hypothetical protein
VPTAEAAVPGGAAGLVDALTDVGARMVTVERRRTLVRYELSLAGVRDRRCGRSSCAAAT